MLSLKQFVQQIALVHRHTVSLSGAKDAPTIKDLGSLKTQGSSFKMQLTAHAGTHPGPCPSPLWDFGAGGTDSNKLMFMLSAAS